MPSGFYAADILLPERKISMKKWACVACDQFSSQPEYWDRVENFVGDAPSTCHMIFPEAYLNRPEQADRHDRIYDTMDRYLTENLFHAHRRSFIYLERTMCDGSIRRGLVGQVDLEQYDFHPGSGALIRATEETVQERIPPRVKLLEKAALEFPHVLLLSNDDKDYILKTAASVRGETVYDFDLMECGGRITGWTISGLGVSVVNAAVSAYVSAMAQKQGSGHPMAFVVGDGNHSLASAKACWEKLKPTLTEEELLDHPARYALVELENIHDPAIGFEPIHRVLTGVDPEQLKDALRGISAPAGHPVVCVTRDGEETFYLSKQDSPLAVAVLQPLLDVFLAEHGGGIDYIHGEDTLRQLSRRENTVGILLPGMEKADLFPGILQGGVLPRKTFSMGEAREKRYYLEGKKRR